MNQEIRSWNSSKTLTYRLVRHSLDVRVCVFYFFIFQFYTFRISSFYPVGVLRPALRFRWWLPRPSKQANFAVRLLRRKHMYLPASPFDIISITSETTAVLVAFFLTASNAAFGGFGVCLGIQIAIRKHFFQLVRGPTSGEREKKRGCE